MLAKSALRQSTVAARSSAAGTSVLARCSVLRLHVVSTAIASSSQSRLVHGDTKVDARRRISSSVSSTVPSLDSTAPHRHPTSGQVRTYSLEQQSFSQPPPCVYFTMTASQTISIYLCTTETILCFHRVLHGTHFFKTWATSAIPPLLGLSDDHSVVVHLPRVDKV